ncbi:Predicted methyltransferase, contains TPR repeat [Devosia enhydra]|uniref:Predicted methyltransferase, contains TPR repeat n=1 Tax=Devosia enhydra TaxID=665118 RepID=A0A1K2HVB9_9HYPH|nr:methyltransferase domain-containing protein [Devosia enhydra]SFZ82281.1 Predicted methyltransferase, contains TPR repeat [Devosia enhydra]
MTKTLLSSGDLIADRRASYAQMLFIGGDPAAAADLMEQALERVPDWPAGLDLLGRFREAAGDVAGAIAAWRELAARDAEGIFGATLKLAVHGAAIAPDRTEPGYVAALFDTYADDFDAALLQRLGYRVPGLIAAGLNVAMADAGVERVAKALDLGCGTGLMGEHLRRPVSHLTGIDLSAGMLAEARLKGIYDELSEAELNAYLAGSADLVDIVTAADVFVYCGALPPLFEGVARVLRPGGLFAFSVETHAGPEAFVLRPSLRYAHGKAATLAALSEAGFTLISAHEEALREDRGEPVMGLVIVARRAAQAAVADLRPAEAAKAETVEAAPSLH